MKITQAASESPGIIGGEEHYSVVVIVDVYFPNCNKHTAGKYIFRGVQLVVIPSELYIAAVKCIFW